jgi:hypothetical protein
VDTSSLAPLKSTDKIVGTALAVVAALAVATGLYYILPYAIELAKNTIVFFGEIALLALMAIVLLDKNTWFNVYYKWRNISRNMRKAIIREDPIGVLSTVIVRFGSKLAEIDENITKAVAAYKRQSKVIRQANDQAAAELGLAKQSQREGKELEVRQHAAAASRWEKTAQEMKPLEETLLNVKSSLERARDLCAARLADLESQKQVMAIKLEAMQDGQKAVKSFKRFFGTNPDLEMQELAVEEIERQSTEAEAEIEQFMRVVNPMLDASDTKRNAEALAAMEKFGLFLEKQPDPKQLPEGEVIETNVVNNVVKIDTKVKASTR